MDNSRSRRHRSGLLASLAAVVLFLGSVVFAASASAQPAPGHPSHPAQGQGSTAQAHGTTKTHHTRPAGHTNRGGSGVSLARPNDFQAQADPDGMTNGGVDQPGGTGGVDTSSQDGNNGSGNDADCEDDNRGVGVPGHCKERPGTSHQGTGDTPEDTPGESSGDTSEIPGTGTDSTGIETPVVPGEQGTPGTQVLTGAAVLPPALGTGTDSSVFTQVAAPHESAVAGTTTTQAAAAHPATGILPNTGAGQALLALLVAGLAALAVGGGLLRRSRVGA